jgi:hypothetical protein
MERTQKIFTIFEIHYEDLWTKKFDNQEAYNQRLMIWDKELKDIPDENIKSALDVLSENFPSWPPKVGEFKQLCLRFKEDSRLPWAHEALQRIEAPKRFNINSNDKIGTIIEEGAEVCKKLKSFYPDLNWMQIADLFTAVKKSPESITLS